MSTVESETELNDVNQAAMALRIGLAMSGIRHLMLLSTAITILTGCASLPRDRDLLVEFQKDFERTNDVTVLVAESRSLMSAAKVRGDPARSHMTVGGMPDVVLGEMFDKMGDAHRDTVSIHFASGIPFAVEIIVFYRPQQWHRPEEAFHLFIFKSDQAEHTALLQDKFIDQKHDEWIRELPQKERPETRQWAPGLYVSWLKIPSMDR